MLELLTVIAIMSILLTAAGTLLHSPVSQSAEPAARMARAIELARAQAVASNRTVAIRFERTDKYDLAMRFLRLQPGQAASEAFEFRRPERFKNLALPADLKPRNPPVGPVPAGADPAHPLAAEESLVISADGQVYLGTGDKGFPVAAGSLLPLIQIGVQPTRAGRVVSSLENDVATVQVQCATGTARVLQP